MNWELLGNRPRTTYIDVFWTNIFSNATVAGGTYPDLQPILDRDLDLDGEHFTVCQFDDGPLEKLPQNTTIFSSGCNRKHGKVVPIPLICSPIPRDIVAAKEKTQFASFVGSRTHPIREELIKIFAGDERYRFTCGDWTPDIPEDSLRLFLDVTASSRFTLCPRGYGPASFRLYEALQLGSVPVYISDHHVLPWADELDWEEFCVIIDGERISEVDRILSAITDRQYERMCRRAIDIYQAYFALPGVFDNILKRIR